MSTPDLATVTELRPLLVTVKDAAKAVGMSERKFRDVLYSGAVKSARHGHSRLVSVASLEAYVEQLLNDPDA